MIEEPNFGLPYEVRKAVDDIRVSINKGLPSAIIIDGRSGGGKTTLATKIVKYYQRSMMDEMQYAMGGSEFVKKFRVAYNEGYRVVVYDEAGDFSKGNYASQFNRLMNEFFEKFRTFKTLVIFCLPFFDDLDPRLFTKRIPRLLLNMDRKKTEGFATIKGYGLYRMGWMRYYLRKDKVKDKSLVYNLVEPNFGGRTTGRIKVKDLPKKESKWLDKLCTEQKAGDLLKIGSSLADLSKKSEKIIPKSETFKLPSHLVAD